VVRAEPHLLSKTWYRNVKMKVHLWPIAASRRYSNWGPVFAVRQSGRFRPGTDIYLHTAMVSNIYRLIARGLVARLIKRGRSPRDAESDASYLLGLAMLANLITLAILLGYRISQGLASVVAIALCFFVLEKMNLTWIRGSIEEHDDVSTARAIDSWAVPVYIFGSLVTFVLTAFLLSL
jgi:hypothetical protein